MSFTATDLRRCADRELRRRKGVFPNRVLTGRMTREEASDEIAMMEAIAELLLNQEVMERLI